jgi:hypothetical protein
VSFGDITCVRVHALQAGPSVPERELHPSGQRRSCDAKKKVELKAKSGKTLRVACTRRLVPPVGWTLVAAPALARARSEDEGRA